MAWKHLCGSFDTTKIPRAQRRRGKRKLTAFCQTLDSPGLAPARIYYLASPRLATPRFVSSSLVTPRSRCRCSTFHAAFLKGIAYDASYVSHSPIAASKLDWNIDWIINFCSVNAYSDTSILSRTQNIVAAQINFPHCCFLRSILLFRMLQHEIVIHNKRDDIEVSGYPSFLSPDFSFDSIVIFYVSSRWFILTTIIPNSILEAQQGTRKMETIE